jgi:hypothetical protein
MSTPLQKLQAIEAQLLQDVMTLSEIISEVTTSRPGLETGLKLLTAQNKLAEAASAVAAVSERLR